MFDPLREADSIFLASSCSLITRLPIKRFPRLPAIDAFAEFDEDLFEWSR